MTRAVRSARRNDRANSRVIYSCWLMIIVALFLSACHEKTNGQTSADNKTKSDTLNKPRVNIKVNRHYDDKGNVVGFDSTYTSFYSNVQGDTATMDSMMKGFDSYFNLHHPMHLQHALSPMFFTDSLRYPDFFHNDFFMKRYELNDHYMRDMMQRMDSIKNRYFAEESKVKKR